MRRTTDVVGETETIWPMTPDASMTGMPTESPAAEPLSMMIVEDHESVEPEITRAAMDWRL